MPQLLAGCPQDGARLVERRERGRHLEQVRAEAVGLEQKIGDTFNIRFGQLAADAEFFIADYSTFLMTSDWPSISCMA